MKKDIFALVFVGGIIALGILLSVAWIWDSGTSMIDGVGQSISQAYSEQRRAASERFQAQEHTRRTSIEQESETERTQITEDAKTDRHGTEWNYRWRMHELDTKVELRTSGTNRIFDMVLYLAVAATGWLIWREVKYIK